MLAEDNLVNQMLAVRLLERRGHQVVVANNGREALDFLKQQPFDVVLNSIVDYVAQLQELDTTGVEPLAHGIEVRNVFRDDVRGPALDREQALANAPKRNQVGFLVPAVLE